MRILPVRERKPGVVMRDSALPHSSWSVAADFQQMRVSASVDVSTIKVTFDGLQQLREAITLWRDDAEDFRLSSPQQRNTRDNHGKQGVATIEYWFWGPYYSGP